MYYAYADLYNNIITRVGTSSEIAAARATVRNVIVCASWVFVSRESVGGSYAKTTFGIGHGLGATNAKTCSVRRFPK